MCRSKNTIYDISSRITCRFHSENEFKHYKSAHNINLWGPFSKPPGLKQISQPGTEECGQVWLGLAWKEEGAGNTDNGSVCIRTMMCRTFTNLSLQITPYHSALSGWSRSRRVRPAGCPGGNEVCWSNCSASAFDLLFLSTGAQFLLLQMTSLIYLLVVFWTPRTHATDARRQRSHAHTKLLHICPF